MIQPPQVSAADDLVSGRCILDVRPSQRVKAVLSADIAHPFAQVIEWDVYLPDPPGHPAQSAVKTSIAPVGEAVADASPFQRPIFLAKVTSGSNEVRANVMIEATLMSRRLRLVAGDEGHEVKRLSADEAAHYTSRTWWADFDARSFQARLHQAGLERAQSETDMAFAHRAFRYIKHDKGVPRAGRFSALSAAGGEPGTQRRTPARSRPGH